jgi:DNA-binding HxlR family transcriptional regulator
MILGKRTKLVIQAVQAGPIHYKDLIEITGIEEQVVKNIVSELVQAQLINRDVNNMISVRNTESTSKHPESKEKSEWAPYRAKLKNLSRIV